MRTQRLGKSLIGAVAGGLAAGALVLASVSPASAHYTCADGTPTTSDDPATACAGHGGIAQPGATTAPTTATPTTATPTTGKPQPSVKPQPTRISKDPATKKPGDAKPATPVKAKPAFTG